MSIQEPSLPPALHLSQMIASLWVPQALHAAAELGIADELSSGPLSSATVAGRVRTHADATDRLMRALVTLGVLTHQDGEFALTDMGRCLVSRAPNSRRAWSRLMGGAAVWTAWGHLVECVRTGRKSYGLTDGKEADTFDIMQGDPSGAAVFHQAMADGTAGVAAAVAAAIDLTGVRTIVDVGGGYGALLCGILEAQPGATGMVFDLAHARDGAISLLSDRGLASRASFVAGSFFESPPPQGDLYLLKSVIHDWDDERSLRILSRCLEAMDDGARLALVECPTGSPGGNPVADWFLTFSDLNMLVNTGGRERTESEYVTLLGAAGLTVTGVRETRTFYKLFECVRG